MCGRVAYSSRSIQTAAEKLEEGGKNNNYSSSFKGTTNESFAETSLPSLYRPCQIIISGLIHEELIDRPNAGPGSVMPFFRRSRCHESSNNINEDVELCRGVWGLIPYPGSHHMPHLLPSDPNFSLSPHYAMFNARSETIYDKRSFRGLVRNGQTCILAVEGFYEWTKIISSSSSSDKRKQPYFACDKKKERPPLLLAGLWSSVSTGRSTNNNQVNPPTDEETLTTFTILTMDAHPNYQWLHPRQPVILWDISIALEWLLRPNPTTLKSIIDFNTNEVGDESQLLVYPVSKHMNDRDYQGDDCTAEVKLETAARSLNHYFHPKKEAKPQKAAEGISRLIQQGKKRTHSASSMNETIQCHASKSPTKIMVKQEEMPSSAAHKDTHVSKRQQLLLLPSWECSQCTYVHIGTVKHSFLACEVCGSQRDEKK